MAAGFELAVYITDVLDEHYEHHGQLIGYPEQEGAACHEQQAVQEGALTVAAVAVIIILYPAEQQHEADRDAHAGPKREQELQDILNVKVLEVEEIMQKLQEIAAELPVVLSRHDLDVQKHGGRDADDKADYH